MDVKNKPHFRVVRFSPVPEITEQINVALLIISDRPRLLVDQEFQKLNCIAPDFKPETLRFWLEAIQNEVPKLTPASAPAFLKSVSSQFFVGEPQILTQETDADLESQLVDIYLRRHRRQNRRTGERQHIESMLDTALAALEIDPKRLLKRARPPQFLSPEALNILPNHEFQFARVLTGSKGIVVMDGINLRAQKEYLSQRTSKVGAAFYVMGEFKSRIESIEHRQILRAAFAFDGGNEKDPEVQYSVAQLQRESDIFIKQDQKSIAPDDLKDRLRFFAGALL